MLNRGLRGRSSTLASSFLLALAPGRANRERRMTPEPCPVCREPLPEDGTMQRCADGSIIHMTCQCPAVTRSGEDPASQRWPRRLPFAVANSTDLWIKPWAPPTCGICGRRVYWRGYFFVGGDDTTWTQIVHQRHMR
jgi:hypothetical protein